LKRIPPNENERLFCKEIDANFPTVKTLNLLLKEFIFSGDRSLIVDYYLFSLYSTMDSMVNSLASDTEETKCGLKMEKQGRGDDKSSEDTDVQRSPEEKDAHPKTYSPTQEASLTSLNVLIICV
jgi:hypothetical protein